MFKKNEGQAVQVAKDGDPQGPLPFSCRPFAAGDKLNQIEWRREMSCWMFLKIRIGPRGDALRCVFFA